MQTLALIGRRILYAALLLLAVIVLNFTLIRLAPGDIVQTIAGQMGGMNEELMLELRHSFQLDKSIPEQLLIYIGKVAHGDLGYSYFFNQPVLDLILGRVGPTVLLVFSSLVLSVVAGTLLGTLASRRLYGPFSPHRLVHARVLARHPAAHRLRVVVPGLPGVRHVHRGA